MTNGSFQSGGRKVATYARIALACGALLVMAPMGASRAVGDTGGALPAHVVRGAFGASVPEAGYEWTTPAHTVVRWVSGKTNAKYPHVTSTAQEGYWTPDAGYTFVSKDDIVVKWTPGSTDPEHAHIVASAEEGQWHAATGYRWANDTPGDLRVVKDGPSPEEIQQAANGVNELVSQLNAVEKAMDEAETEYNVAYLAYLATDDGSAAESFARGYMIGVKARYEALSSRRDRIAADLRSARSHYENLVSQR